MNSPALPPHWCVGAPPPLGEEGRSRVPGDVPVLRTRFRILGVHNSTTQLLNQVSPRTEEQTLLEGGVPAVPVPLGSPS